MSEKVTFHGDPVSLSGTSLKVGDLAPEVTVVGHDLSEIKVGGKRDKKQILLVVPSVDTPVCSDEIAKVDSFSEVNHSDVVTISMDLPFSMARYGKDKGIKNIKGGSDFRNKDFANAYGVLIADGPLKGLTCRAVFVIDKEGKIAYKEICSEIGNHPDYDALKKAVEDEGEECCGTCN